MKHGDVIAILGDRGTGKTLFAVNIAKEYSELGQNVYSNIDLYKIKYIQTEFKDISSFPDWLRDGIIIMDEMHVGADAYAFLRGDVQNITNFITQIRKRNLTFIYITQNFTTIVKRLRLQTNYVYEFQKVIDGIALIKVFDVMNGYRLKNEFTFDGRHLYTFYDTYQIIT